MSAFLAFAIALSQPAGAASLGDVGACLLANDVPCAEAQVEALGGWESRNAQVRAAAAEVHFHAGRYAEAYDAMKAAVDLGYEDRGGDLALYERTMYATSGWVEEEHGRFRIRWRPGMDDLLLDDAANALVLAEKHIAPLLGGPPPGTTILELYPDEQSFTAASSLMKTDVQTTGVVALSKWTRLLVTSPRALPRGYDWADTIAHEYIHLVVAHRGNGQQAAVPVWMQEAIAKYLDSRWRDGRDHFQLSVRQQGLLAEAIQSDDFVTFDEMHPSLAKLETADRAALAYAQLATLMQFCFERKGERVLLDVLPLVRGGMDPRDALAKGSGFASFDEMMAEWRVWVAQLDLVQKKLAALPVQLEGGDDLDLDPVLAEREDLQRYVTLGQEMTKAKRPDAALVYYAKAMPEDEPPPPVLSHYLAEAHLALGDTRSARSVLEASVADYPEFPRSHKLLGQLHAKAGDVARALDAFGDSAALNPFDPEVQGALAKLYGEQGNTAEAERHARYVDMYAAGGGDVARTPLHDRVGAIEVPDYPEAAKPAGLGEDKVGKTAPLFDVPEVRGGRASLADYAGQVVVVDFWATWCPPCREMMPHLSKLQDQHPGKLVVIGLTDEPLAKVKAFLKSNPVSYVVGVDAREPNAAYGIGSLPTAVVIGKDGKIVDVVIGGGPEATQRLERAIDEAFAP